MLKVHAYETLSGQRLTPLPTGRAAWSVKTNADESVTASVDLTTREAQRINAWDACTPVRGALAAFVDGEPVAAGPIWKRTFDGRTMELTAGGVRSYLARRLVLPVAARTLPLVLPNGDPNTALDIRHTPAMKLSLGTIGKRYMQVLAEWPGGALPIDLPEDVYTDGDGHEREVKAVDFKVARTLIDNLSGVIGGPDFEYRAARSADGAGVRHVMRHGTPSLPRLGGVDASSLRFTLERASKISVTDDATGQASESFATGGGQSDRVVAARGFDPYLLDQRFPLLQVANKGNDSTSVQATVQGYADQDVMLGKSLSSAWSLTVPAKERGTPRLGTDYWLGDLVTLRASRGYPIFPDGGEVVRRIAGISGDQDDDAYKIVFAEVVAS